MRHQPNAPRNPPESECGGRSKEPLPGSSFGATIKKMTFPKRKKSLRGQGYFSIDRRSPFWSPRGACRFMVDTWTTECAALQLRVSFLLARFSSSPSERQRLHSPSRHTHARARGKFLEGPPPLNTPEVWGIDPSLRSRAVGLRFFGLGWLRQADLLPRRRDEESVPR